MERCPNVVILRLGMSWKVFPKSWERHPCGQEQEMKRMSALLSSYVLWLHLDSLTLNSLPVLSSLLGQLCPSSPGCHIPPWPLFLWARAGCRWGGEFVQDFLQAFLPAVSDMTPVLWRYSAFQLWNLA